MRKINFKNTITDYSKGRSCCNKHKHFNKTRLTDNIKQSIYGVMVFCGLTVGTCSVAQSMFGEESRTLSKNIFGDHYEINKLNNDVSIMNIEPDTLPSQPKVQQLFCTIQPVDNIFINKDTSYIESHLIAQNSNLEKKKTNNKDKEKKKTNKNNNLSKDKLNNKSKHSNFVQHGIASHMGHSLHGRKQASGERHNKNELICAHKTLPFGTRIRVTNLKNGESVVVRVTDRGPFGPGRIVDLSLAAAKKINIEKSGIAKVKIEII